MAIGVAVTSVRARLVTGAAEDRQRPRWFRPLVVGPAVLVRPCDGRGPWQVPVTADGRLRPVAPASRTALAHDVARLVRCGHRVRVTAALVSPVDAVDGHDDLPHPSRSPTRTDFYGWSLLYQFPDMHDVALVDPHEQFVDLPAMYESPLELVDRAEFLAGKGIASRPLVVVVQPHDFSADADGRWVNRFYPESVLRPRRHRGWPA